MHVCDPTFTKAEIAADNDVELGTEEFREILLKGYCPTELRKKGEPLYVELPDPVPVRHRAHGDGGGE